MRRILLFLVAFASLAIAPIATSHAQDLITPTWTKSSSAGLVGVSKNGAVLLSTNGAIIRAWSTATQKLLAIVPVFADSTTPANDGSGFYYTIGSPGRVYKFTFATQTTSLIHTEPANYQTAQRITMSNDGTRLAFKAFNTTTSRHNIVVCDATTGVTANRWPIPGGADTQQISFVNNDQKICLGGLRLYTVTGTLVATALSFPINTFAVSPNTDIIYGQEQVNGRLIAYNVSSGLNWMWSTFDPSNISAGFKVSSDGNTLISSGQDDEDSLFGLESYSTYDGLSLNKFPATSDTTISSFALHPTTNTVFYWDPLDYSLKKNTYSVNGTQLTGAVFSEYSGGGEKIQMVGTSANPKIALDDNSSNYTNLFNANTGGSPFVIGVSSAVFSPDGTHYLWIGFHTTYGLHVYRVSDNVKVGTYTSNDVENAGWGSNGKVWAYRNTGRVRCFDFTGAALNLINDWAGPTSANLCMSSSGARLAWTNGNGITIYNVNNAATVGVLNPGSNGEPFSVRFCGNSLAVHDIEEQGTVFTNRLRIFDVTSAAFPILRQASYDMGALHDDHGAARVSDDQSIAVFVRGTGNLADGSHGSDIRVFRMWDGAQLRKYDNQFGDFSFYDVGIAVGNRTATWLGADSKAAVTIELPPVLNGVAINPSQVNGGTSTLGTVTLNRPAPAGGVVVSLTADTGLTVPASVTVSEGNKTANFTIGTSGVDVHSLKKVNATYDGLTWQAGVVVTAPVAIGITLDPTSVDGGQSATGTITLDSKAGPSGYLVNLSSDKGYATVPATATVPAGAKTVTFTVTTVQPGSTGIATITGTHSPYSGSGTLEVKGVDYSVEFLEPTIKGGNALTLRIELAYPAPTGGLTFTLTGDSLCTPPPTVFIPAGASVYEVGVDTTPVLNSSPATLLVQLGTFDTGHEATSTIEPPVILLLKPSVTSVTGAKIVPVYVFLDAPAPTGLSYNVSSSSAAITVPTSVSFTPGSLMATFNMSVKKQLVNKSVTITVGTKTFIMKIKAAP